MSHEMAARYCFIDYDRELAIVAEVEQNGQRELAGVVHLVCDVDHVQAEYAVLVTDNWQGYGLGTRLTRVLLGNRGQLGISKGDRRNRKTQSSDARHVSTLRLRADLWQRVRRSCAGDQNTCHQVGSLKTKIETSAR